MTNLANLQRLWLVSALGWLALTLLMVHLNVRSTRQSANTTRFWRVGLFILVTSAALQTTIVITHDPTLSDDLWRYILDGGHTASGADPYTIAPESITPQNEHFPGAFQLAQRTNNPDLTTIYLPGSQLVFFTVAGLSKPQLADPHRASIVFRLVFVAFNVGLVALILAGLGFHGRSAWWACVYAWHPLVLIEVAASGHQDVVGIAAFFLALLVAVAGRSHRRSSTALWISTTIKPAALPLLPFTLRDQPRRGPWIIAGIIGAVCWITLLVIFDLFPGTSAGANLARTFDQFVNRWEHFGSVYSLLRFVGLSGRTARALCVGALALLLLALWDRRVEMWKSARIFLFAAVLLSTTAHPWYLLWPLAVFAIRPSAALWIASLTLPWGYVVFGDVVNWTIPKWVPLFTYTPVYLALALDVYWRCQRDDDRDRS